MMTLPFFICAGALFSALRGHRGIAALLTVIAVLVLFVLFRLHATDVLDIDL
ncbi:DUF5993 family protein [Martelella lutilitoris]|uniref:DUF5993 family protein n=1 Tax=Martelella lutilitoris TaxID=2583532 RepID=UPI001650FC93|nr:DUF5993 family protein [Martelella lutilitoris]